MLTHKGTVPVSFVDGRSKPWLLRVTIGGKRQKSYWATKEEAVKEWNRLAPLAGQPGPVVTSTADKALLNDKESAGVLLIRERLAAVGLTLDEAFKIALTHKDTPANADIPPASRVVEKFIASYDARVTKPAANYVRSQKWSLARWLDAFGAKTPITAFAKRGYEVEFAQWANSLGYKPDSVLMLHKAVRGLLNFAVEMGYIATHTLGKKIMRRRGLLPPPRANQGHTLTVHQAQAMLALFELHAPDKLKNIATQLFIGFRENQTERMRDDFFKPHLGAFDLPPGIIRKARDGSTGDYIDQLPENLVAWITCPAAAAKTPTRPGRKVKVEAGKWKPIGRALWKNILARMATLPGPYRLKAWQMNAARHTAATAAYSHFGLERTCALLGWADMKMLKNQYAGKRWPAEEAAAYFEITPGISKQIGDAALRAKLAAPIFAKMGRRKGQKNRPKPALAFPEPIAA